MVKLGRDAMDQSECETLIVSLRAHPVHMVGGPCFRMPMGPPPKENVMNLNKSSEAAPGFIYNKFD